MSVATPRPVAVIDITVSGLPIASDGLRCESAKKGRDQSETHRATGIMGYIFPETDSLGGFVESRGSTGVRREPAKSVTASPRLCNGPRWAFTFY